MIECKIIGLGNLLMADDGVGIHAVNELMSLPLPQKVEVIDGGNCGWGLLTLIEGAKRIIFIDALADRRPPGSIVRLDCARLSPRGGEKPFTPHHLSLLETLRLADILGFKQERTLIGVTPARVEAGTSLSPRVQASLPRLIEAVLDEVERQSGQK